VEVKGVVRVLETFRGLGIEQAGKSTFGFARSRISKELFELARGHRVRPYGRGLREDPNSHYTFLGFDIPKGKEYLQREL
jgi:hypothetical protein